ncbi:MAG: response regulator [Rhodobacteraceae bacterium]|nr:response regulator [Paracoccaceae bacterium]
MPPTIEAMLTKRRPTAEYPLLGQTILVIEDSRFASEALRLMCLRSGARIRRADSLRAAARHLATYRPSIAVIDLGLPDGSGLSLISEMAAGRPPVTVILATSGDDTNADVALEAGAHGFLPKPVTSIAGFQVAVLDHLPKEVHPKGPRPLTEDIVLPDPLALRDDLAHAAEVLRQGDDPETMEYLAQFLAGLGRSAGDVVLQTAAEGVLVGLSGGESAPGQLARLTDLVTNRLNAAATV